MNLPAPVTITPRSGVFLPDGTEAPCPPVTLSRVGLTLVDNSDQRSVTAFIHRAQMRPLVLWEGDDYDAAGDYTQAQAESRLLEKLGTDIKAGLEALFARP